MGGDVQRWSRDFGLDRLPRISKRATQTFVGYKTYLTKKQVSALDFSAATAIKVKILRRRPAAGAKLRFSVVASAASEENFEQKWTFLTDFESNCTESCLFLLDPL